MILAAYCVAPFAAGFMQDPCHLACCIAIAALHIAIVALRLALRGLREEGRGGGYAGSPFLGTQSAAASGRFVARATPFV